MSKNYIWKWTVKTYNPECFQQEVVPAIAELGGEAIATNDCLGEALYWVRLPAHVVREEIDSLRKLDVYSVWELQRRNSYYNPPD